MAHRSTDRQEGTTGDDGQLVQQLRVGVHDAGGLLSWNDAEKKLGAPPAQLTLLASTGSSPWQTARGCPKEKIRRGIINSWGIIGWIGCGNGEWTKSLPLPSDGIHAIVATFRKAEDQLGGLRLRL